jgi:transposase
MESIAVGIDVSKDILDVYIDCPGSAKRLRLSNDVKGIAKLKAALKGGNFLIALEASGRYEAKVRHALENAGFEVRVQNPRLIRRLAEGLGIQAKTDLIDAHLLARTANLCARNEPRSKEREILGDLQRTISMLKKERTAHLKRLAAPGFCPLAAKSLSQLVKAIDKEICALEKAFEKEVANTQLQETYKLCQTIPGVGPALARTAVCELPENLQNWTPRQIASYAGLAPLDDSSGKRQGYAKLGKHGNMHLKAALYMPALTLLSKAEWAKTIYRKLRAKGKAHQQAIVAIMRKLLLQLVAILKRGTAWQPVPTKGT